MATLIRSRYHLLTARIKDHAPEWRKMLVWLCVLVLAFNASCAAVQGVDPYVAQPGYIEPVRFSAVLAGIRGAIMEDSRSLIMYNSSNQMVMFAWPRAGGWAWTVLSTRAYSAANALRQVGGSGNLMSCSDFSCLTAGAEKIGYRQVTAADLIKLAPAFCQSVLQQTANFAAGAMTSIFVVPAGVVSDDPWATVNQ